MKKLLVLSASLILLTGCGFTAQPKKNEADPKEEFVATLNSLKNNNCTVNGGNATLEYYSTNAYYVSGENINNGLIKLKKVIYTYSIDKSGELTDFVAVSNNRNLNPSHLTYFPSVLAYNSSLWEKVDVKDKVVFTTKDNDTLLAFAYFAGFESKITDSTEAYFTTGKIEADVTAKGSIAVNYDYNGLLNYSFTVSKIGETQNEAVSLYLNGTKTLTEKASWSEKEIGDIKKIVGGEEVVPFPGLSLASNTFFYTRRLVINEFGDNIAEVATKFEQSLIDRNWTKDDSRSTSVTSVYKKEKQASDYPNGKDELDYCISFATFAKTDLSENDQILYPNGKLVIFYEAYGHPYSTNSLDEFNAFLSHKFLKKDNSSALPLLEVENASQYAFKDTSSSTITSYEQQGYILDISNVYIVDINFDSEASANKGIVKCVTSLLGVGYVDQNKTLSEDGYVEFDLTDEAYPSKLRVQLSLIPDSNLKSTIVRMNIAF